MSAGHNSEYSRGNGNSKRQLVRRRQREALQEIAEGNDTILIQLHCNIMYSVIKITSLHSIIVSVPLRFCLTTSGCCCCCCCLGCIPPDMTTKAKNGRWRIWPGREEVSCLQLHNGCGLRAPTEGGTINSKTKVILCASAYRT